MNQFSNVELSFLKLSGIEKTSTKTPYIIAPDLPKLSLLMALRFVEWVAENPEGVICLPADKHASLFIRFTHQILDNWDSNEIQQLLKQHGIGNIQKPSLSGLHFVQSDEFFPISPLQHNSAYNFVMENYINGFGLDIEKAWLINSDEIKLFGGKTYKDIFPDCKIDLSLRYREAKTEEEEAIKQSIFKIDDWCSRYEHKVRQLGGIGFYLSPIGPDGHIAYNIKGSDLFSTTRLCKTNFETQADAATTLGGINVAKNRLVITIGLETITYNPNATAIIFAAGEANADIVKASLESKMTAVYPATVLQRIPNGRFYLTEGSACKLEDSIERYYTSTPWDFKKTERAIIDLCNRIDKYAHKLTLEDLQNDRWCSMIPNLSLQTVQEVVNAIISKLNHGKTLDQDASIYHTGPHHDDIMLGIMPYANRQLQPISNNVHFAVATSGYNSVTNSFVINTLHTCLDMIEKGDIQMLMYADFFTEGYKHKRYKDIYHFLDNCAQKNEAQKSRGLCHRVIRDAIEIWHLKSVEEVISCFKNTIEKLKNSYDGCKNSLEVQLLKGRLREFEEELVWNYAGVAINNIHHWRLSFYQGGKNPDNRDDVNTILEQFRQYKPNIISLAFDPEGSGPDTHYKVLQAIASAIALWNQEEDLSKLRIIGYRNVWFKFHPADATMIVPVSMNDLAIHAKSFEESYLTQVEAAFPSPECDGPFSEISRRIWVKQLKQIQHILGKDYFYENEDSLLRATHGLIYLKEMSTKEFIQIASELKKRAEGENII